MPKWIVPLIVILSALAMLPAALIFFARSTNSPVPRISIIPDMDTQQKFKTQAYNNLFADHRASRLPVKGTVAYGETMLDGHFYRGIVNGDWAKSLPVPVTEPLMQRGQQRFGIYCAPCHGLDGSGNGPVAVRAEQLAEGTWVPPLNFSNAAVMARPVGHLFNTVTNGIRNMPAYGAQIPPEDRWAIVAYVKALQRSQHGTLKDVTPEERQLLEQQKAATAAPAQAALSQPSKTTNDTGKPESEQARRAALLASMRDNLHKNEQLLKEAEQELQRMFQQNKPHIEEKKREFENNLDKIRADIEAAKKQIADIEAENKLVDTKLKALAKERKGGGK